MGFDYLSGLLSDHVAERPLPILQNSVIFDGIDEHLDEETSALGYAEGQTFIIEYVSANGDTSTRRITVFEIGRTAAGHASLMARCHERKALRQFRVDRIVCCIDYDGEIYDDVPRFLHETFGMDMAVASGENAARRAERWASIRDSISADATLLVALSHADGLSLPVEREVAIRHFAFVAEANGFHLSDSDIASIEDLLRRIRPGQPTIERALNRFATASFSAKQRLLNAARELIDADGHRHPAELELLTQVAGAFSE